jgi:hypothetical protein
MHSSNRVTRVHIHGPLAFSVPLMPFLAGCGAFELLNHNLVSDSFLPLVVRREYLKPRTGTADSGIRMRAVAPRLQRPAPSLDYGLAPQARCAPAVWSS